MTEQGIHVDKKYPSFFTLIEELKKLLEVTNEDHVIAVAGIIVADDKKHVKKLSAKFDKVTDAKALDAKLSAFVKFDGWKPTEGRA